MHIYTKELLEHCADFSKQLLKETKDLYPFGAFISKTGQLHPLELEKKNSIKNGEVVESLLKYLVSEMEQGEVLAYATTYEVQIKISEDSPISDAIAIEIVNVESEKEPVFYIPYRINGDEVSFEEPFAVKK